MSILHKFVTAKKMISLYLRSLLMRSRLRYLVLSINAWRVIFATCCIKVKLKVCHYFISAKRARMKRFRLLLLLVAASWIPSSITQRDNFTQGGDTSCPALSAAVVREPCPNINGPVTRFTCENA